MKYILISLIIFLTIKTNAQIDSTKLDSVRVWVQYFDSTHKWTYVHANGVPLWKDVPEYDVNLIPPGGKAIMGELVKPETQMVKGFALIRWRMDGGLDKVLKWMDVKYKEIKGKDVIPLLILR